MSKRFSATEIWDEDWFIDLPSEYKLFWFYMLSACDHAGFFKVNVKSFCSANSLHIDPQKAIKLFNNEKSRVRVLKDGFWFIEDFIHFQYGSKLNRANNTHKSILILLEKFNINILSVRGMSEVSAGASNGSMAGLGQV